MKEALTMSSLEPSLLFKSQTKDSEYLLLIVDQVRIELTTLSLQGRIAKPWYMPAQINSVF